MSTRHFSKSVSTRFMALLWTMLLFSAQALAGNKLLGTKALLSCMENSQFQAKSFSVVFDGDQGVANVSASAISNIDGNFTANVQVIAYGINIITKEIKSCSVSKTLCPIAPGHFEVDTTFDLPKDVTSAIPGIAYTFPNLDGVVRVKVYQSNSTQPIACVEAQLDNFKTVQTKWASWGLFIAVIIGIIVAAIMSMLGHISTASHISANIVSLFSYFQSVAVIGMMAVYRMPPIAAAWVENFVWTMGIIETEFMQKIFTWYVRSTGGTPTNILPNKEIISIAVYRHKKRALDVTKKLLRRFELWRGVEFIKELKPARELVNNGLTRRLIDANSNYTTTNEKDESLVNKTLVLQGIKRVAFMANIELSNMFLTSAVFFSFIGLLIVVLLGSVKLILELLVKTGSISNESYLPYRQQWHGYTRGVLYRYFLISFTMLSVMCLWEFTNASSVATVITAAIIYAVVAASLLFATSKVVLLARKSTKMFQNPAYILYGNNEILNRWGFLYVQYRATHYWFLMPFIAYIFVKSAVIAFGQANGKVQAVIIFAVELAYMIALCWFKPYMDKKTNGFNIAISVICFVNSIFFLFFSQLFGEKADVAASICGVVFFILNAVVSLVLLIMIIVACIWAIVRREPDSRYQPMRDDRDVFMSEVGDKSSNNELDALASTARDGYRESFVHYTHDNSSWADDNTSHSVYGNEPEPAVTRYATNDQNLDSDYPLYRHHQAAGAAGGLAPQSYSYGNDYNDGLLNNNNNHRYA